MDWGSLREFIIIIPFPLVLYQIIIVVIGIGIGGGVGTLRLLLVLTVILPLHDGERTSTYHYEDATHHHGDKEYERTVPAVGSSHLCYAYCHYCCS